MVTKLLELTNAFGSRVVQLMGVSDATFAGLTRPQRQLAHEFIEGMNPAALHARDDTSQLFPRGAIECNGSTTTRLAPGLNMPASNPRRIDRHEETT